MDGHQTCCASFSPRACLCSGAERAMAATAKPARELASYTVKNGVAVIQFQDPKRKNAWSAGMFDSMVR